MRPLNPTVRGFAIILIVAGIITAFSLQPGLALLFRILQVVFLAAIAFALYRLWRSRRSEIATWSLRSRALFYGAPVLALADIVAAFVSPWPTGGLEALIFFFVLAACAFTMWRVWRDEHTYGY